MAYLFGSTVTSQNRRKSATVLFVSLLTVTGCGEPKRVVESIATPPERLVCELAGTRPAVPAEYAIDWTKVRTVPQAKAEHEKFVATLRTREGIVAGYVVQLEGKNFTCWTNMEWRKQFEAGLK